MADYYPLLARAVATLPDSTPEMRRAIYERARKALLTQLRASDPPMSEENLEAESRALDTAVERLEAELSAPEQASPQQAEPTNPEPQQPEAQDAAYETADASPEPAAVRRPEQAKAAPFVAPSPRNPQRGPGPSGEPMIAAPARMPGPPRPEAGRERPRPQAALSDEAPRGWRRPIVWGPLLVLLLAVAAFAAWRLRVPPEDFAGRDVAQAPAQQQPVDPGKINQRADGSSAAPATPAQNAPAQQAQTPAASAEIPVAQRAAILVQASPNDPQNVETHVGTTVWRLEPGQRPGTDNQPAIRADVDIPPIGMKLAVTIEKNNDPTLRASHTMTLRFSGENGKLPAVAELGTPQMRNETAPTVDPLAGVQAKITDNIFIVALTGEPTFAVRNAELLKTRGWFDFPLRLADGRIAKITIEKGAPGARVFDKAFAEW